MHKFIEYGLLGDLASMCVLLAVVLPLVPAKPPIVVRRQLAAARAGRK